MGNDERNELKKSIQAVLTAIGREQNTHEFYDYLANSIEHPETREFFKDIVGKESNDIKQTEDFLKELENDLKKLDESR